MPYKDTSSIGKVAPWAAALVVAAGSAAIGLSIARNGQSVAAQQPSAPVIVGAGSQGQASPKPEAPVAPTAAAPKPQPSSVANEARKAVRNRVSPERAVAPSAPVQADVQPGAHTQPVTIKLSIERGATSNVTAVTVPLVSGGQRLPEPASSPVTSATPAPVAGGSAAATVATRPPVAEAKPQMELKDSIGDYKLISSRLKLLGLQSDRAWVQVDSKQTEVVAIGDPLPDIGRVTGLNVQSGELVAERGYLKLVQPKPAETGL